MWTSLTREKDVYILEKLTIKMNFFTNNERTNEIKYLDKFCGNWEKRN